MKLNINFPALDRLISQMGAPLSKWRTQKVKLSEREILRQELEAGKEVSIDQIHSFGGLLEHEGEQILIYIKATGKDKDTLLHDTKNCPKFHFAECATIRGKRKENRLQRYHATIRMDGKFECTWTNDETREEGEIEAELIVCKNCLKEIAWKGYGTSDQEGSNDTIAQDFEIADFLRTYEPLFHTKPSKTSSTPTTAIYPKKWAQTSLTYRSSRQWKCEECGVNLSKKEHRRLLHTHHITGDLSDSSHLNLKALCILCHAGQPNHGHMKVSLSEQREIEALRHA
ncbi:hypothetical protein SAMN04488518_101743 [Pseudovibrio ascidiaceicola]|uniref:HNH endonuclease n=1 Tax=Pseudovibrio ascidiaceicola TaxID=285279 RepID=A0A1I3W0Q7_9HYPH|nr:hypothetical protein [Pseudovibrio ascidiaceicola]SFK01010.1 hypothetical protein SAMN04488518_101743 [Pseudovibrio ascidiaceicola]